MCNSLRDKTTEYEFTVGVIIPNRNDSRFLRECFYTVLNQTSPFDEIIFVDDASDDNSVKIVSELCQKYKNIQSVRLHKNVGTVNAINIGIGFCNCDYVLFLSANDRLALHLVERLRNTLKLKSGVWSALCSNIDESGMVLGLRRTPVISSQIRHFEPNEISCLMERYTNWFAGTTLFFNLNIVKSIGGLDAGLKGLADWLLAVECSYREGAVFVPEVLGFVTRHKNGYLLSSLNENESLKYAVQKTLSRLNKSLFLKPTVILKIKHRIDVNVTRALLLNHDIAVVEKFAHTFKLLFFYLKAIYLYRHNLLLLLWAKIRIVFKKSPII